MKLLVAELKGNFKISAYSKEEKGRWWILFCLRKMNQPSKGTNLESRRKEIHTTNRIHFNYLCESKNCLHMNYWLYKKLISLNNILWHTFYGELYFNITHVRIYCLLKFILPLFISNIFNVSIVHTWLLILL